MKQTYLLCFALFSFVCIEAQIIDIPDANFKDALVNDNVATFSDGVTTDVDTNNDGEIDVSEAEAVISLDVSYKQISSMEGIQYFTSVFNLVCTNNSIAELDLTSNTSLAYVSCR